MQDFKYPEWKKIIWRFLRVFISAFLVTGSLVLVNVGEDAFRSWGNFKNLLAYPFLLSGLVAGVNAIGKLIRTTFGSENKESLVDKLPF